MTVAAWARSRGLARSSVYKALGMDRIHRDADGLLDPSRADREWAENTRPRIDGRHPGPPEPVYIVKVDDALEVNRQWTLLLARALVAEINRLAPELARSRDAATIRETLYRALMRAAKSADAKLPAMLDEFAEFAPGVDGEE